MHRLAPRLVDRVVHVAVVGCGATGSAVAGGLAYLHQSLVAFGHPGIDVTLIDGDDVSPSNVVRQPFSAGEIGHNKAVVLATRMNLFWGFSWDAIPRYLDARSRVSADLVIGCVDTRAARRVIAKAFEHAVYWLDYGNEAEKGQFVLGQLATPKIETGKEVDHGYDWKTKEMVDAPRLAHVGDLYPELLDPALDQDDGPSCSAREALTRQAPFMNQVLANHGLAFLAQLFRKGQVDHQGAFVNLATGRVAPIDVKEIAPKSKSKKRKPRRRRQPA